MYPQPPSCRRSSATRSRATSATARGRVRRASRRRLRGARRGRRRVGVRPARGGELRRGRRVPDHVPDRVDPDDAAGAHPPRHDRARHRRGGRRRHRGDPGRGVLRRARSPPPPARTRSASSRAELGAQRVVTYEEIDELDDIDVAFDPVGGPVFASCIKALRPLGVAIGIGFAGGTWEPVDPARLVGRNVGVQGFYLGRLMGFRPDLVRLEVARAARALAARRAPPGRRRRVPARAGERGARPDRVAAVHRARSSLFPETAVVTGAAGGIGRATRRRARGRRRRRARARPDERLRRLRPAGVARRQARRPRLPERGRAREGRRHDRRLPPHPRRQRRRCRLRDAGAGAADARRAAPSSSPRRSPG